MRPKIHFLSVYFNSTLLDVSLSLLGYILLLAYPRFLVNPLHQFVLDIKFQGLSLIVSECPVDRLPSVL